MINSVAFATYEPGLATSGIRNSPDNYMGLIGQALSPQGAQMTNLLALAVVLGLLLWMEHVRLRASGSGALGR